MKASELVGWFREACTDWDGSQEHDLAEPVHVVTCGQLRQAADLIEAQAKAIEEMRGVLTMLRDADDIAAREGYSGTMGSEQRASVDQAHASHSKEGEQG